MISADAARSVKAHIFADCTRACRIRAGDGRLELLGHHPACPHYNYYEQERKLEQSTRDASATTEARKELELAMTKAPVDLPKLRRAIDDAIKKAVPSDLIDDGNAILTDLSVRALLAAATTGGSPPTMFGNSMQDFKDGDLGNPGITPQCLLRPSEHRTLDVDGGYTQYLDRHVFTHDLFGDNVVEIYSSGMGNRFGGGGSTKIRLLPKSEVRHLEPLDELMKRFNTLLQTAW